MTAIITLPTFHPGQVSAFRMPGKPHKAIKCGRRWGKTDLLKTVAADGAAKSQNIGWFTPDYKTQTEAFHEVADILVPVKRASSRIDGVFRTTTGGRIDFWTLENERAGRSRKYHKVLIDEAAFTKSNMLHIWETAILPSLLDYSGYAIVASTPNGNHPDNFFHTICTEDKYGFSVYHAPTFENPFVPVQRVGETDADYTIRREADFAKIKSDNHPLVYQQEFMAEFVDWSGVSFFALDSLLIDGKPVGYPKRCHTVFATIDTAVKTGLKNDTTSAAYWAFDPYGTPHKLTIVDWDVIQVEGATLEVWLPTVFKRLEELANICGSRLPSIGAFIEDKASGSILLQQAANKNWPARAIDSKLTALGKDERAINVSGYVFRGEVKLSEAAWNKTTTVKGSTRNHFVSQILGYRVGGVGTVEKNDDALDAFCYGIAIALGNADGF